MFPFDILREIDTGELTELNEPVIEEQVVYTISGWMDLITGSNEQQYQNSLLATSTNIFLSEDMSFKIESSDKIRNPRTGEVFEITFVDDVMELADHYEIYCKRWS